MLYFFRRVFAFEFLKPGGILLWVTFVTAKEPSHFCEVFWPFRSNRVCEFLFSAVFENQNFVPAFLGLFCIFRCIINIKALTLVAEEKTISEVAKSNGSSSTLQFSFLSKLYFMSIGNNGSRLYIIIKVDFVVEEWRLTQWESRITSMIHFIYKFRSLAVR